MIWGGLLTPGVKGREEYARAMPKSAVYYSQQTFGSVAEFCDVPSLSTPFAVNKIFCIFTSLHKVRKGSFGSISFGYTGE